MVRLLTFLALYPEGPHTTAAQDGIHAVWQWVHCPSVRAMASCTKLYHNKLPILLPRSFRRHCHGLDHRVRVTAFTVTFVGALTCTIGMVMAQATGPASLKFALLDVL
eukprot:3531920-Amphidinium_carterae.1